MFGKGKISFGKIGMSLKPNEPLKEPENLAVETVSGFGKFGGEKSLNIESSSHKDVADSMGFSSFGIARQFDLSEMVEESRRIAAERNKKIEQEADSEEGTTDPIPLNNQRNTENQSVKKAVSNDGNSDDTDDDDDDMFGPPLPPAKMETEKSANDSEDESDGEEDNVKFPIDYELHLMHGDKTVSALTVDPAGSRLVSGSVDYDVKYWDFQGMDLAKEAFRSFRPTDGYPINSVEYSCTGDKVLVVPGSAQAKVYDRDGVEIYECVRGDMYLHDMGKTKGHIAGLSDGKWHPKNKEEFLTAARDGTCRIWNISKTLQQVNVLKPRALNGLKTHPTSCSYSRDGLLVSCVCDDGSVQMWDHRKNFVNTTINIHNAHGKNDPASCLTFSYDNKSFVTRGEDTLKLWDIRNNKSPLHVESNLFSKFSMTDCLFSPNDKMIVTGTSMEKNDSGGKLKFFDRNTFNLVKEVEIESSHVVRVVWHPRLNQIMLGCGNGEVRILYDPKESRNGAILVAEKRKKRTKQAEIIVSQQIITPHALPLFREERHKSNRKMEEKDRKDPMKSKQPELPLGKTGSGGRVSSGGSTLSSYIIRNMGIRNKVREEGDPREALLKHAKEATENPYWVTPAYSKTQPTTLFDQTETEEEHQAKKLKKV